jgi:hypothetical protein
MKLENLISKDDEAVLAHLTDLWIDYKEDPREYDFVFVSDQSPDVLGSDIREQEFSNDNPYFSDRKLVKQFRLADIKSDSKDIDIALMRSYDLSFPLTTSPVKIDWTSDDHNLIKKKPRVDPSSMEEFECVLFLSKRLKTENVRLANSMA